MGLRKWLSKKLLDIDPIDKYVQKCTPRKNPFTSIVADPDADRMPTGLIYPDTLTFKDVNWTMSYIMGTYLSWGGENHNDFIGLIKKGDQETAFIHIETKLIEKLSALCETEEELFFIGKLIIVCKASIRELQNRIDTSLNLAKNPGNPLLDILQTPINILGMRRLDLFIQKQADFYIMHNALTIRDQYIKAIEGGTSISAGGGILSQFAKSMPQPLREALGIQDLVDPDESYAEFKKSMHDDAHRRPSREALLNDDDTTEELGTEDAESGNNPERPSESGGTQTFPRSDSEADSESPAPQDPDPKDPKDPENPPDPNA